MGTQSDEYSTIKYPCSGNYKSKGSKFLSFAYPIHSESDAHEIINDLKKEYHDARHHCYAYVLREIREDYRINDDGEPSGTAGRPILGQIHSKKITDVLIVVIRYFGGTLLGTGGLVTAYKSAAKDALQNAVIITKTINDTATVQFEYEDINHVMRILNDDSVNILSQDFKQDCSIHFSIRKSKTNAVIDMLNLLKTASCEVLESHIKY